jgi:hypothetical protein
VLKVHPVNPVQLLLKRANARVLIKRDAFPERKVKRGNAVKLDFQDLMVHLAIKVRWELPALLEDNVRKKKIQDQGVRVVTQVQQDQKVRPDQLE